jgi:hypothetical protein
MFSMAGGKSSLLAEVLHEVLELLQILAVHRWLCVSHRLSHISLKIFAIF